MKGITEMNNIGGNNSSPNTYKVSFHINFLFLFIDQINKINQPLRPSWIAWTAALPQNGSNPSPIRMGVSGVCSPSKLWGPLNAASGYPSCRRVVLMSINPNGRTAPDSTSTDIDKIEAFKTKHQNKPKSDGSLATTIVDSIVQKIY